MATIAEFEQRLRKVNDRSKLEKFLFDAIRKTQKIAFSLNKQQLSEGYDREGRPLGVYSEATEVFAKNGNPRQPKIEGQPYNFEWTGDFFDGFVFIQKPDQFEFWSKDEKTPFLVEKYGEGILGLDDENLRNYLKNSVLPIILLNMRKTLLL